MLQKRKLPVHSDLWIYICRNVKYLPVCMPLHIDSIEAGQSAKQVMCER